ISDDYDLKRREALERIDNAKFGWFHIRACIVSGVGFFTDAYDIFAINLVAVMLGYVYFGKSSLPGDVDLGIKVATPVGTFIGQFAFGILADILGRKKLLIIVFATFACCLVANSYVYSPTASASAPNSFVSNASVVSVQGLIIFWRVILGIGIGGDYPLSAVITSEFATTKRRGAMMSAVFAMQGIGILVAAIVSTITIAAFHSTITPTDYSHIDYCWRIVTGIGAVPGVVALYFRLTIPETPRFTMDIERNVNQAVQDISTVLETGKYKTREQDVIVKVDAPKASISDFFNHFGKLENGKVLFGTAFTWFVLDVAFYGIGLNNNIILKRIGFLGDGSDPYETLFKASVGNIIIALLGTVPGYWGSVLGAIISQVGFFKLKDIGGAPGSNAFMDHLFKIFAAFMFAGLIATYFCVPETKGTSLEDLSNENQAGFVKSKRSDDN
ncbi:15207_t:CDS:2, partial [Racocetra fulgida]